MDSAPFADLIAANRRYANSAPRGFDGVARAGVAIITCMDSRLQPLEMIGLMLGEAKVLRTPGGRLTPDALVGCVLGVHLLGVNRILIVQHTKCAACSTNEQLRSAILERSHFDTQDFDFGVDPDQPGRLHADVETLRTHPLLAGRAEVGGFSYDVDTGLLTQLV